MIYRTLRVDTLCTRSGSSWSTSCSLVYTQGQTTTSDRDNQIKSSQIVILGHYIDLPKIPQPIYQQLCDSTNVETGQNSPKIRINWPYFGLDCERWAIAKEAKLDGKWLLRTSDQSLSPADLALAYKQLLEVERGWRDMKGSLGLRPVFHHQQDRIRSHIQLCWLGLLLIRVIENGTGDTWRNVRNELDRMHLVTMETKNGRFSQRTAITPRQAEILRDLKIKEPGRYLDFEPKESSK